MKVIKIAAIEAKLEGRVVSNSEVVELIRDRSEQVFEGDMNKSLRRIEALLRKSEFKTRRWLNREEGERAIKESGFHRDDIEICIYVGIGRGLH